MRAPEEESLSFEPVSDFGPQTSRFLRPLTFFELLSDVGSRENVLEHLRTCWETQTPVDAFVHDTLLRLYRRRLVTGGFPQVQTAWRETGNYQTVEAAQKRIIRALKSRAVRRNPKHQSVLNRLMTLIPQELAKPDKRFFLKHLDGNAKFARLKDDIALLEAVGAAVAVRNVKSLRPPLTASVCERLFKFFPPDVGLLTAALSPEKRLALLSGTETTDISALFETAVLQELTALGIRPFYFADKRLGEVDFVFETDDGLTALEVACGRTRPRHRGIRNVLRSPSCAVTRAVVLDEGNLRTKNGILFAPVYMAPFLVE